MYVDAFALLIPLRPTLQDILCIILINRLSIVLLVDQS